MAADKRIALVTGANRGIGYEACRQLADAGMHVVLTSRDVSKGEVAARAIQGEGKDVRFHQLDVTDEGSVAAVLQFVKAEYGRLDVLINNAGVYLDESVSVFDVDMTTFRTTMEILGLTMYQPRRTTTVLTSLCFQRNTALSVQRTKQRTVYGFFQGQRTQKTPTHINVGTGCRQLHLMAKTDLELVES